MAQVSFLKILDNELWTNRRKYRVEFEGDCGGHYT